MDATYIIGYRDADVQMVHLNETAAAATTVHGAVAAAAGRTSTAVWTSMTRDLTSVFKALWPLLSSRLFVGSNKELQRK